MISPTPTKFDKQFGDVLDFGVELEKRGGEPMDIDDGAKFFCVAIVVGLIAIMLGY